MICVVAMLAIACGDGDGTGPGGEPDGASGADGGQSSGGTGGSGGAGETGGAGAMPGEGGSDPDGARPPDPSDPGAVTCNGSVCQRPEYCCPEIGCVSSTTPCERLPTRCDGQEDCEGEYSLCCAFLNPTLDGYDALECAMPDVFACGTVCHVGGSSECATTEQCVQSTALPEGFGVCRSQ